MSDRTSSGAVVIGIMPLLRADDGYKRKHFPEDVRPARPARWLAEATEQGVTDRTSIPVLGLYVRSCIQAVLAVRILHPDKVLSSP